jgi:hypothetical protein
MEEIAEFGERIHEAVIMFTKMRDSSFWSIQTFRIGNIFSYLTRKEVQWLRGWVRASMPSIQSDADVGPIPLDLPKTLEDPETHIYAISVCNDCGKPIEQDGVQLATPLIVRKFSIVSVPRHTATAGAAD